MPAFWNIAAFGGPALLAIMGAVVTLRPSIVKEALAWAWVFTFVIVALVTAYGTNEAQKILETEITGGNNFPEVIGFGPHNRGIYNLKIVNPYDVPLFYVTYDVHGPFSDIMSNDERFTQMLHPIFSGNIPMMYKYNWVDIGNVGPGTYNVNMLTRNGAFFERFYLPTPNEPPERKFSVYRLGDGTPLLCNPISFCPQPPSPNDYDFPIAPGL